MAIAGLVLSGLWVLLIIAIVVLVIIFDDGSVRATSVKVGDCIEQTPTAGSTAARLPKVSCNKPHDGEVYAPVAGQLDELGVTNNTVVVFTTDNGAEVMSWPTT